MLQEAVLFCHCKISFPLFSHPLQKAHRDRRDAEGNQDSPGKMLRSHVTRTMNLKACTLEPLTSVQHLEGIEPDRLVLQQQRQSSLFLARNAVGNSWRTKATSLIVQNPVAERFSVCRVSLNTSSCRYPGYTFICTPC